MHKRKNRTQARLFITTGAAARVLGVTRGTVRAAVRRGELRGIRLGNRVLIRRESLERLLQPESSAAGFETTKPAAG
jgi:excisionase family DNA binding protein